MRFSINTWLLTLCIITCGCESRNAGSRVFQNFDPSLGVLNVGRTSGYDIELISKKEPIIRDHGYSQILWLYQTRSRVDDPIKLTDSICKQYKAMIQKLGADVGTCDERVGSFILHRFNYDIDARTGGWIDLEVTKRFDRTDILIKIKDVEQAAPCDPY